MQRHERTVDVPGARLFAVDEGDGPPILLLHAGIADQRAWDGVVPYLTDAGYRVVRPDMRGLGRSTTEDVEFTRRGDVVAVMDALGIPRAALVGNSIGGMTALDLTIESPERVVALVLVATGIGGFDGGETPQEQEFEAAFRAADAAGDAAGLADLDVRLWVDGVGRSPTRVDPAIRELVREMDLPSCTPGHVMGRNVPMQPPANERLEEVRVPVLAIGGELDVVGSRAAVDRLVDEVPDAMGIIVPDVAHMIGMEVPDVLAGLILDHLAPLARWG